MSSSIQNCISRNDVWRGSAEETFQNADGEKMKTKNLMQTFVIALAMTATLTIGTSLVSGQDKADKQSADSAREEQSNTLEGTWQSVVTPRDCQTGVPAPFSFKALTTFMQGGTMSEDGLDPSSPYRTTGHGIWQHTSGRHYTVAWMFYTFAPNGTFTGTTKVRVNKTLSRNANSLTGDGTVEVYDPNGNLVFTGCSNETATRFTF
jgi:hypothetical protein